MNTDKLDRIADEEWRKACEMNNVDTTRDIVRMFLRNSVARLQQEAEPVAWYSTLSFDGKVADRRVTLQEPRYPFGVAGADYRREGSRVDWQPLYAFPPEQPAQSQVVKDSLTTQQPAQSAEVPAGMVLVPKEITPKISHCMGYMLFDLFKVRGENARCRMLWDELIAAAAPARPVGGEGE